MKWVGCPRCRTLTDVERSSKCDGCSEDLSHRPELRARRRSPEANAAADRDVRVTGRGFLLMLGLLALGSLAATVASRL
ncbi:MAG TPA: hypothetical protein VEN81_01290 [Planctomycetota bacterium]|nr:hypothetical protein [Planctomycetota bacterium]